MQIPPELLTPNKREVPTTGLPTDDNHDPSNVIFHDGLHYLWYTQHEPPFEPFVRTHVDCVTSPDGRTWTRRGTALRPGWAGEWDAQGVLTCYVVPHGGRYHMFYTGVGPEYTDSVTSPRGIGLAIAMQPDGPWDKHSGNPVLWPTEGAWDALACDDANVIFRNGMWWLYYKGRRPGAEWDTTEIGLATSDRVTGPYVKHPANPLAPGHALTAWVHRSGVALLAGNSAPQVVQWSTDGVRFTPAGPFPNRSTGLYCPEDFGDGTNPRGVTWGIDTQGPRPRRLFRFDCDLAVREDAT